MSWNEFPLSLWWTACGGGGCRSRQSRRPWPPLPTLRTTRVGTCPLSNPKGMWQWLRLPWSSHEHVEGSQRSDTVKKLGCCRTVQVDRLWHNSLFGLWRTKSETRPDCDLSYIVLRLQQINTVSYTLCLRFEKFFSVQKYFKNKQKKRVFLLNDSIWYFLARLFIEDLATCKKYINCELLKIHRILMSQVLLQKTQKTLFFRKMLFLVVRYYSTKTQEAHKAVELQHFVYFPNVQWAAVVNFWKNTWFSEM